MLNQKTKKAAFYILMAAVMLAATAASPALAQKTPPAPDDGTKQTPPDQPNLIMTLDGNVTTPNNQNEEPYLYQTQDNSTATDQNSTRAPTQNDQTGNQENALIATQAKPDLFPLIFGSAGAVAAAIGISTLVLLKRKKAL